MNEIGCLMVLKLMNGCWDNRPILLDDRSTFIDYYNVCPPSSTHSHLYCCEVVAWTSDRSLITIFSSYNKKPDLNK